MDCIVEHKSIVLCKKKLKYWRSKLIKLREEFINRGFTRIPLWFDTYDLVVKINFYEVNLVKLKRKYMNNEFKIGDHVMFRYKYSECYTHDFIIKYFKIEKNGVYAGNDDHCEHIADLNKVMPKSSIMLAQEQCAESYLE